MDLDELHAFLAIVEHGSQLEAARALGISRTTLRRRAEALEERSGVPLFETTPSGVHVTQAGAMLAQHGQRLVQESAAVMSAVKELGHTPAGTLRMALPCGLPPQVVVALWAALQSRHGRLGIQTHTLADPIAGRLDDVDLAFHFGARAAHGSWVTKRLASLRIWLLALRNYLARRGTPESLGALTAHPLLVWTGSAPDGRSLPLVTGERLAVEPAIVSADVHMLRQAAIAGLGIALLPDALIPDPGFTEAPLVRVLPELVVEESGLWVAVPEVLRQSPKVRALFETVTLVAAAFGPPAAGTRQGP